MILLIGNYTHDRQESMQRFASMMLEGLRNHDIAVELIAPRPFLGRLKPSSNGIGKWLGYFDKFILFPFALRRRISALRSASSDLRSSISDPRPSLVVHICDHSNAFYARFLQDVPHVVTCHDLLAVRSALGEVPENPTRWSGRRLQAMVVGGLARARHVVCISEATERDVHRLIPLRKDRVSMIPVGLNYPYSPMPEGEATHRVTALLTSAKSPSILHPPSSILARPPRFILHVGGNQWYKNRLGVLRIYARAVATNASFPPLVMAGKPFNAEMDRFVAEHQLQDRVWQVSECSSEDLRALYSLAGALLFPSLAEGFGWPVIEAQACGCPVLCSQRSPLTEVTLGSAAMHDPSDEAGFSEKLLDLLSRPEACDVLSRLGLENARRFTPEAMIRSYIDCYRQLGVERRENARDAPAA